MKNNNFTFLSSINTEHLRAFLLFAALCIYAIAGSPTPDAPGLVELVIAALLVGAVGIPGAYAALRLNMKAPLWRASGQALLLYGLSVPFLIAATQGVGASQVLRDVFPFLFMLLPVFLVDLSKRETLFKWTLAGAILISLAFAMRALIALKSDALAVFAPVGEEGELTYFANAPTLLFSALFIVGYSGQRFLSAYNCRMFLLFFIACFIATLILSPVILTTQRATLGYVVFYSVMLIALAFYKMPYRAFVITAAVAVLLWPFYGTLHEILFVLAQKTSLVGFNARFEELAAVWSEVSKSIPTILFGSGWGGSFESPAVAEIRVNYTHGLLSSALLKTGLIGLILVILYLFGLALALGSFLRQNPVLALALAGPILIDVFLYASFKSLDFGVILLLITAYTCSSENVAKTEPV